MPTHTQTDEIDAIDEVSPHDAISSLESMTESEEMQPQWDALSNFADGKKHNVLPLVDVSPSMEFKLNIEPNATAARVAALLGLHFSAKNQGAFSNVICPLNTAPKLHNISSEDIKQQLGESTDFNWEIATDIEAVLSEILKFATENSVSQAEMPNVILAVSDVPFEKGVCGRDSLSANSIIREDYKKAGYEVPNIIFWNLNNPNVVTAEVDKDGIVLISGFNPSILKAVLSLGKEG
jgi:hypothetical protein